MERPILVGAVRVRDNRGATPSDQNRRNPKAGTVLKVQSGAEMTTKSSILPNPPESFDIDKTLAGELLKLNFKDRIEIEEDIHGVRGGEHETQQLLEESLANFDEQLNVRREKGDGNGLLNNVIRITGLDKTEAEKARSECYLNDPDIRIRFLRCQQFHVEKAVDRFINFLLFSSQLYGDFVAEREISLSDFNAREQIALQNSRTQYLPFRDRSGRRVFASVGTSNFDLDTTLRFKILIYLHWIASQDIETQQKGVVFVVWIFDEDEETSWQHKLRPKMKASIKTFHTMHFSSLPVRLTSFHQFFPQNTVFFRLMRSMYVFHMAPSIKNLYRSYFGDQVELLYLLSSFGVPVDLLPVSSTGKVKTANQASWVSVQRAKLWIKDTKKEEEIVDCPRSADVVFKKGPGYRNNPGNVFFRGLIEQFSESHQTVGKEEKYQITLRIVESIEEVNGRFLEWSKSRKMWLRMNDRNKIRSKVASSIKQYNRQRSLQIQQLKTSMTTATMIHNTIAPRGKREPPTTLLGLCAPKRPKTLDFGETHTAGDDTDKSCFGLFPTKG